MRRPGEDDDWDMWMPKLSPSHELLNKYKYENLSWNEMSRLFKKEVLQKQKFLISWIGKLAMEQTVTLLCWEETPDFCHRKLVAESCKLKNKKIEIDLQ